MMLVQMRRREVASNIDSFDVTQTILLLGVIETFGRSSKGRSTITVENHCAICYEIVMLVARTLNIIL